MTGRRICFRALLALIAIALLAGAALARQREPNAAYAERRAKLRAQVAGPVVLFGYTGREDTSPSYVFNQEHYFYYLTGHNEPGAALVIVPDPPEGKSYSGPREILFLQPRNLPRERWDGPRIGPDDPDVREKTGFADVEAFPDLRRHLEELAKTFPNFHAILPGATDAGYPHARIWFDWLKQALPQSNFQNVAQTIATMRQVKSPTELKLLERSTEVSIDAHLEAMRMMRPGIYEYQVAARMEFIHKRAGCEGAAYAPIVGAGFNSTVLHYNEVRARINEGDVVVLDVGAQCDGYAADITRTLPASGKFTPRQREIYKLVLGAQNAAIAAVKPGATIVDLTRIAREYMDANGKNLKGHPLTRYFIHGLGHHVGLHVHDPGPARPLEPGMVFTIEPGIYIPEENLGVRIEDMVLVTETGYKLLTARLPRTAEEVEKFMADAKRRPAVGDSSEEMETASVAGPNRACAGSAKMPR